MKFKSLLLTFLLLAGLLSGCSSGAEPAQVAATTLPVYQFTSMLCQGTGITVTRLVTENVSCLHDYALSVSQVRSLEAAQTVVISGAGLEDFLDGLLDNANLIDSSEGIATSECGHSHDHDHHHEEDAHIWLAPGNAKRMAQNICAGLCLQYPQHRDTLEANLQPLQEKLDALQTYGETQLNALSQRELITFHDGFSYFAHAFGLTILKAIEEESGSEASAQELKELIGLVRQHDLNALFTETNGSASAADIIAAETGAAVYTLDMAMAGDDYFAAMYRNIDTIREALG